MQIIFILAMLLFVLTTVGVIGESLAFNKGKCKCCNKKLRHFDNDSQGGRGYICDNCNSTIWISYHCVDRKFS